MYVWFLSAESLTTSTFPNSFASLIPFAPQIPLLQYAAVSSSLSRFMGTCINCVVAPPCRNKTSCSLPKTINSFTNDFASSSTSTNQLVRWPISRIDNPVLLKFITASLACRKTSAGNMDGPELKLCIFM